MPLKTPDVLQGEYLSLQHGLIKDIDAAYGIKSEFKIVKSKKHFPTGVYWERDARTAKQYYCGDDDDKVVKNNLLLRLLATTRGIDHMLQKRAELYPENNANYEAERQALKALFEDYQAKIREENTDFKALEKAYNFELAKILHVNCLDFGLKTTKAYQKLLLHYRCLASVLDPAPSVRTVLKDKTNNVTHIETAHPITEKTAEQLEALREMERIALKPLPEQKNYHTVQKFAFQEANMTFAELIQQPDRRLPAQTRKTHAPTVKNGYLTHYAIQSDTEFLGESWALRAGTAVYVGSGESDENLLKHAEDNFKQMMLLAAKMAGANNLHITLLNTLSPLSRQHIMVKVTDQARKELGYNISYVPLNLDGTFRITEISSLVREHNDQLASQINPWNKSGRLTLAVGISTTLRKRNSLRLDTSKTSKVLDEKVTVNLITCASGQDRTGTLCEASAIQFASDIYQEKLLAVATNQQTMERLRARGMHNAFLATLAAPGSLGMKSESLPGDYFLDITNKQFYLQTAHTNSQCPLGNKTVEQLKKVNRHAWAARDLPRVSALWHGWQKESVFGHIDTPRMTDTQQLDTLIEQYKLLYEAKPNSKKATVLPIETEKSSVLSVENIHAALSDLKKEKINDTIESNSDEKINTEKLLERLGEIETVANKWLASKWNQVFSDRVQAVKNLKRSVAIEKSLLANRADFELALQSNLENWRSIIHEVVANKTNSSGIKKMYKLVQNIANVDDLKIEQKIVLLKHFQAIADDRLEKNFFKQLYCKASFFGKAGRKEGVQAFYKGVQASAFLTSNSSSPSTK